MKIEENLNFIIGKKLIQIRINFLSATSPVVPSWILFQTGIPFNQTIVVNGQTIQYTAYGLPNGIINIGRIHGIK
jgi:hypothetical protein